MEERKESGAWIGCEGDLGIIAMSKVDPDSEGIIYPAKSHISAVERKRWLS
jgi:hypothetical protein